MQKTKVSIVVVHYHVKKVLFNCLESIHNSRPRTSFEIIVVDNDELKTVERTLKNKYPEVKYISAPYNLGYGKGNNLGIENAKGEYVFILNPDTIVEKGTIDKLVKFIEKNKRTGIVAPTLKDGNGKAYRLQGTRELNPLSGIFALSFLNKILPDNPISKKYWLLDSTRDKPLQVDIVPGSAFLIKKSLFKKIGGFDKNFFLYFEEADLCKRVKEAGYRLFILPDAKIIHFWAVSTPKSEELSKIFAESRFYYFKKNYGILSALLVEPFARLSKWNFLFLLILILGTVLRFYKIDTNLIFNGEMGYDYMTIKDFVMRHQIPFIGPRTSHEWFFIGPIFYWIFGLLLPLFHWSVFVGAYFFAVIGVIVIVVGYLVIKNLFDEKTALISSFLLSFSPLWVSLARDARFNGLTALLFFPFYFLLVKSIKDKGRSLFLLGLTLGAMFSFFPSPILLLPGSIITLFIYRKRIETKYLWGGIFGVLIPIVPWLLYNIGNKFDLLINILIWIPYRVLGFIGIYHKNTVTPNILSANFTGLYNFFQSTYLYTNHFLIFALFITVLAFILLKVKRNLSLDVLLIVSAVSYLGLFLHGNPPSHYYLVIYPVPIIFLSLFLVNLLGKFNWLVFVILAGLFVFNLRYFFSDKWFYINTQRMSDDMAFVPYSLQVKVAEFIIKDAEGKNFSLGRVGPSDYFGENFSLNYQYLLRNMGNAPIKSSPLKYTIYEDTNELPRDQKIHWVEDIAISKNEQI